MQDLKLNTPVYLKTGKEMELPKDKLFYLLTRDGLFLCRNHDWFQSCVPAKTGPSDLEEQKSFVNLSYPLIPRALMERAVGFFHLVHEAHGWESALLLVWDRQTKQMDLVCPDQKASAATVKYTIPNLPHHLTLMGDIHCHGRWGATASGIDEDDEFKRPGIHLVVGNVDKEPPELFAAAVVDGHRFELKTPMSLIEDYLQRDTKSVPREWIGKVKEKVWTYTDYGGTYYGGGYQSGGYYDGSHSSYGLFSWPSKEDKRIIHQISAQVLGSEVIPNEKEISRDLFIRTKKASSRYCDQKAAKIVKKWHQIHPGHEETVAA